MADNAGADGAQTVTPAQPGAGEGQSAGGSILAELEAAEPKADAGSPSDPWGDPEFLKRVESLDFTKAPEAIRRKVEAPFVKDYTPKWQAVAKERDAVAEERRQLQAERERIFNVALDRLKSGGVETPTQTVQDQIRERLEAGDMNAIPDLVKQEIEREVGPIRQQQAFQKALQTAVSLNPLVRDKEPEIAALLQANPELQQAALVNNYQFAPLVLAGLADRLEKTSLAQQIETLKASFETEKKAYARRAIEEFRARGATLPPVTSQAGSGGTAARNDAPVSFKDVLTDAFVKAGGTPDPRL